MKLFFTILLLTTSAFAGDGGYSSVSCVSDSGRTLLSVFNDNFSGSSQPSTIRLIIDGQMAEYKSAAEVYNQATDSWIPADPMAPVVSWNDSGVIVSQFGMDVLKVKMKLSYSSKKYSATVQQGFLDPRKGTEFEYYITPNATLVVNCTEYYAGP